MTVAMLLLLLVWLIPIALSHTPLMNLALNAVGANAKRKVAVKSASLGWLSPVWLGGIEVRDEHGQVLLEVAELAGDRPLWSLLWNSNQLGRFKLVSPKLYVALREDGSNVEDLLVSSPNAKSPSRRGLELEVIDGRVELAESRPGVEARKDDVADAAQGRSVVPVPVTADPGAQPSPKGPWKIEKLRLALRMPADQAKPIEITASGSVPNPDGMGEFALDLKLGQPAGNGGVDGSPGPLVASLKTEAVPLDMLNPILGRLSSKVSIEGRASTALECQWNTAEAPGEFAVQGKVEADRVAVRAAVLGSDEIKLQKLRADCKFASQAHRLRVDQFVAECDVGRVAVSGVLQANQQTPRELWSVLRGQTYEVQGQADLSRLSKLLPNTLRISKGTDITSGKVSLALTSRQGAEGMIWQGSLETTNLTAVNGSRPLVWEQPLRLTLSARETGQGPILDKLKCESSFLKVNMAGTRDHVSGDASFDLSRLASQLNGLIDLGSTRLAGDGWANFNWKRSQPQGDFQADGEAQLRNLQLALPDRPVWTEGSVTAIFSATGRTDFSLDSRLDQASLKIEAGPEHLEARLLQPVAGLQRGGVWPLDVRVSGQIARWIPRVGVWTPLADWNASGVYDLRGQVSYSPEGVRVSRATLTAQQLALAGPGFNVREPMVKVDLSGRFTTADCRLEAEQASLMTNSLAVQTSSLVAAWPAQGPPELAGVFNCRGSLEQVQQWFDRPGAAAGCQFGGQLEGNAEFRQTTGGFTGRFETVVRNLTVTHSSGRKFQEPLICLEGRGVYDDQSRMLKIEQVKLTSGVLSGIAAGQIAPADGPAGSPRPEKPSNSRPPAGKVAGRSPSTSAAATQLAGQIEYDMEKLSPLIQACTGAEFHFAGRESTPISYRGPLGGAGPQATAAIRWKWGEVCGFRVDAGELQLAIDRDTLQVRPVELQVSEGRVYLAPQVRLSAVPREIWLPPGKFAEQLRINPVICATALQYVAPVLAGITNVEGRFSVELTNCRIPLADPAQSDVSGRLTLHAAQVSPGPLLQEFAILLNHAAPAQLNRDSAVEFRMVEKRVYHRGLELAFPEVTIRTYGSVGLDETVDMVAEMPIPPKWRENRLLAAALKGQERPLQLRIGGVLQKPKLDRSVLERISSQFLRTATQSVIDNTLTRQLDRLLAPTGSGDTQTQPQASPQTPTRR